MSGRSVTPTAALLALADQRLPTGGHVHSGGVEQAVADARVRDAASLAGFLERRLRTAGLVAAAVAAAAHRALAAPSPHESCSLLHALDGEADARMPVPAHRDASRAQGRGLLRTAKAAWAAPSAVVSWADLGARPHHPIALGCASRAAGLDAHGAATVAAYLAVTGPATAAQRLLALDPVQVAAVTLLLGHAVDEVAAIALDGVNRCAATGSWRDLPDSGDPLLDLLAARHATRADRLFAS